MPLVESSVICVVSFAYPAVQFRTFAEGTPHTPTDDDPFRQTSALNPPHESDPVNFTIVCVGPAPRSVTLLAPVVSHEIEYGDPVSSAPRFTPSSWNWTPTTPTLSLAVAVTVVEPVTVAPATGAVTETVGGTPSSVVKEKSPDTPRLPAA